MDEDSIYDFPDVASSDENGLVAIGGNLSSGTLINAYSKGIFPWYNPGDIIQWYSPDPRFVLFPGKIKISHSMRNVFNKHLFKFTVDKAFTQVVQNCRFAKRPPEKVPGLVMILKSPILIFSKKHWPTALKPGKIMNSLAVFTAYC